MRLESLDGINAGEIGASALQKEAMRISKIDTIRIDPYRVKNDNPLASVDCLVDVIFIDNQLPREPGKPIALEQTEIGAAIHQVFRDKYMNKSELFPMTVKEGQIVLKVTINAIEALVHGSTQNFGLVDENTIFRFKVGQKSQQNIKVNSNEAKQLFKENVSF